MPGWAMMHYWASIYINEGQGTLHDPLFFNANLGQHSAMTLAGGGCKGEIMQLDAGMCATATVLDAMVHSRRGIVRLFQGAPAGWRHCQFENIYVEGGFRISARRGPGEVEWVHITANRPGTFQLENPWRDDPRGRVITLSLGSGEVVELKPSALGL